MSRCLSFALVLTSLLGWPLVTYAAEAAEEKGYVGIQFRLNPCNSQVEILAVLDDSPAAKAGLKVGDYVLKIGDVEPKDLQTVVDAVTATKPGDKLVFKVKRFGKDAEDIAVTVGKRPSDG
jgi:S1-C subfamily serine protease